MGYWNKVMVYMYSTGWGWGSEGGGGVCKSFRDPPDGGTIKETRDVSI